MNKTDSVVRNGRQQNSNFKFSNNSRQIPGSVILPLSFSSDENGTFKRLIKRLDPRTWKSRSR